MIEILLRFKCNKYVMLKDLRKAFLMIKLKREEDKNRFCFFMKEEDELLCYRYNTLIFRFTTSPFILNYILKCHTEQYQPDEHTKILKNNFYVDNLHQTNNHPEELIAIDRLRESNFNEHSCNTKSEELKSIMAKENTICQHEDWKKILGYNLCVIQWHINILGLFYAKSILLEGQ